MKTQHSLAWLAALVISSGLLACGGDDDDDGNNGDGGGGTASISGVIPGDVFLGRDADVLIIGSNTEWAAGVSVSFGDGITVGDINVASPTSLLVAITADDAAALGTRNVTVGDLTFTGAFEVVSPLKVYSTQGVVAQGSISVITIQNIDFANQFDTTSFAVEADAGPGTQLVPGTIDAYTVSFTFLVDVSAASDTRDLEILSGPQGQQVSFILPGAIQVGARTAIPLELGAPGSGTVNRPFESFLYKVNAKGPNLIGGDSRSTSADAAPGVAVLPATGSFADILDFNSAATAAVEDDFYLIYWDNTGASDYSFQVQADVLVALASLVTESEPNNNRAQSAMPDGAPAAVNLSALAGLEDEDWTQVTLTAEQIGDGVNLRGMTFGPDPMTDTVVRIFQGDVVDPIAESDDLVTFLDDVSVLVTEPDTYYVQVTASVSFDPLHSVYNLAVLLEPPL